ncbi:MAG TPA: DUF5703 domain-containing protein, partial [Tepidisphaeraceae bacterium]|nr:DUF5703 domain-containing protein [Tepidisphaeraceae bacterium]
MLDRLDQYNVTWDTPSTGTSGSMPLGNGDVGVNVWVEPGGDVLLLIAKSDAWDENSINLKLGRVRLRFTPNPLGDRAPFRQALRLKTGDIEIGLGQLRVHIWVDANAPVIRIETESERPFEMQATLEIWRTTPRQIKTQTSDMFKNLAGKNADPYPTIVTPDHVLSADNRIVWCHHNEVRHPDPYAVNMVLQGLGEVMATMPHPLLGRTFGAAIVGDGFALRDPHLLCSSQPSRTHRLNIHAFTSAPPRSGRPAGALVSAENPKTVPLRDDRYAATATIDEWQRQLDQNIAQDRADRANHESWWSDFWNRSWIYITSNLPEEQASTFQITQAYILCRFMNAAAGRGASPIKHNGSLFSVGQGDDPDFRRWGGPGFWFQNQRLIYWPMLAAGDFDFVRPWLDMYTSMLPLQRQRTAKYFHHGGAHYPETVTFWGAEVSAHYEWIPFEQRESPEAGSPYLKYYWTGGVELSLMLCEYFAYTNDRAFAQAALVPVASAVLEFFDLHYPRDADGRIRFEPAQSLETWHEAINPLPEIAGLRCVLTKMLALPQDLTSPTDRQRWTRTLDELPPIPIGERDGKRVILPAERFDKKKNTENPELYCVFPYRLFGIGKPDLQLARDTFAARLHKSHDCWSQDDIQMALLGLTDEAKQSVTNRA